LQFLLSLDVNPDLVAPWSRPDVSLNTLWSTSWRIGLESRQGNV